MAFTTILSPTALTDSGFVDGIPSITALSDGGFALTFTGVVTSDDASSFNVITYAFSPDGILVGGGPALPPMDLRSEAYPELAGLAGGGYALAWEEWLTINNFYQPVIYTTVYNAQGNQISSAPIEASSGLSYSELPEVTALNGGGYALTWHAANSNPDLTGDLYTRFFNSTGAPVSAAINLTGPLGGYDQLAFGGAPIGLLTNGNVVYSWRSGPSGQGDVYTAIYSPAGGKVVGPTNLTNTPSIAEDDVQLAVLSGGHYALSWQGESTSTFQSQIYTAVYDSAGNQIAAPLVVSGGIGAEIVALSNGGYAVAWVNGDIYTAVFNAQGALVSSMVNLTNTGGQLFGGDVEIAALQSGNYALAWVGGVNALPDLFTAVVDAHGNVRVAAQDISNSGGVEDLRPAIASQGDGTYAIAWMNSHTVFLYDQDIAIFQFADSGTPGDVTYVNVADISLDLSALVDVGGNVTISDNDNLVTLDLHNLVSVGGNFVLSNNGALLTITLPSLVSVGGNLDISGNTSATVVDAGSLTTVSGDVNLTSNSSVETIDLSALTAAGAIVIADNGVVTLNLGALVHAGGDVLISDNQNLLTIDMPELTSIGGDLVISNNAAAGVIDVGSTSVGGDIVISNNASAGVINVAGTNSVGGDIIIDLTSDATVDASALGPGGGTVHVIGDDGHEVDVILGSLAGMQGLLTITTADGVTLTSEAGLATITLTGTALDNTLIGSATANNLIDAGTGNDMTTGGAADDTFAFDFSVSQHTEYRDVLQTVHHHDFIGLGNVTSVEIGHTIYSRPALTASITAWKNWDAALTTWANMQADNSGGDHFASFTNANPAAKGAKNTVGTIQLVDGYFHNYDTTEVVEHQPIIVGDLLGDGFDSISNFSHDGLAITNGGGGNDSLLFRGLSGDSSAVNYWAHWLDSTTAGGNTTIHLHDITNHGSDISAITLLGVMTDVTTLVNDGIVKFGTGDGNLLL